MSKLDKLTKIQNIVTSIKQEKSSKVVKTSLNRKRLIKQTHRHTDSQPRLEPLSNLLVQDSLDPVMRNIEQVLSKCDQFRRPSQTKLHTLLTPEEKQRKLSTQKQNKIYGSKRVQIEARWKEIYQNRFNMDPSRQQIDTVMSVEELLKDNEIKQSSRVLSYQRRMGLIKKKNNEHNDWYSKSMLNKK